MIRRGRSQIVGLAMFASAVASAAVGTRPSGFALTDTIWACLFGAVLVRSATRAPAWATGFASLALMFAVAGAWAIACAAVAFACLVLDLRRIDDVADSSDRLFRALVLGVGGAIVASVGLRVPASAGRAGSLATVFSFAVPLLADPSLKRYASGATRRLRRLLGNWRVVSLLFILAASGGLLAATSVLRVRDSLLALHRGHAQIRLGDVSGASDSFRQVTASTRSVSRWLGSPIVWPIRSLPLLGRHTIGAQRSLKAVETVSTQFTAALVELDRHPPMSDGSFDLVALRRLGSRFDEIDQALEKLDKGLADSQTAWLPPPINRRLRAGQTQLRAARAQSGKTVHALQLADSLLGGRSPRTMLIAFLTPAEARGLGGLVGNYAVVHTENGRITLKQFGRTADLNQRTPPTKLDMPTDFLERYGRYGATSRDGQRSDPAFWSNVAMSPDLPSVARAMAQMMRAYDGTKLDGVIAVDPDGLRAILGITGPVTAGRGSPRTLTELNVVEYLSREQYFADEASRSELLGEATKLVLSGLSRIDSAVLRKGGSLAEVVRRGHLQLWSFDSSDQNLLLGLDVSGRFPEPGVDGFSVTLTNANPNKIDSFLTSSARYRATIDENRRTIRSTLTVELDNAGPSSGLPETVIGNQRGAPPGSNTMIMSVYSPLTRVTVNVDGVVTPFSLTSERGWNVASFVVRVPSRGRVAVVVQMEGVVQSGPYTFVTRTQPMVSPMRISVDTRSSTGEQLVSIDSVLEGVTRIVGADSLRRTAKNT